MKIYFKYCVFQFNSIWYLLSINYGPVTILGIKNTEMNKFTVENRKKN